MNSDVVVVWVFLDISVSYVFRISVCIIVVIFFIVFLVVILELIVLVCCVCDIVDLLVYKFNLVLNWMVGNCFKVVLNG